MKATSPHPLVVRLMTGAVVFLLYAMVWTWTAVPFFTVPLHLQHLYRRIFLWRHFGTSSWYVESLHSVLANCALLSEMWLFNLIHFPTTWVTTQSLILNNMYVTHVVCLTLMLLLLHLLFFLFCRNCLFVSTLFVVSWLAEVKGTVKKTYDISVKVYQSHFSG